MTSPSPVPLQLRVEETRELNGLIRLVRLGADDGSALPGYTAGAHLRVQVELPDGKTDWRHYSLITFSTRPDACDRPTEYVIACGARTWVAAVRVSCTSVCRPARCSPSSRRKMNSRCKGQRLVLDL